MCQRRDVATQRLLDSNHYGENRIRRTRNSHYCFAGGQGNESGVGFVGVLGAALFDFDQFGIDGVYLPAFGVASEDIRLADFHAHRYIAVKGFALDSGHVGGQCLGGGGSGGGGGIGGSGSGSITTVAGGLVGLTTSNQNTETQYEQELFHGTILCQKNLSFIILYDNRH